MPKKCVYVDEKIIHRRSMRDFLVANGGILKKTKKDLRNEKKEIYIFKESSVSPIMGAYEHSLDKGEQKKNGN